MAERFKILQTLTPAQFTTHNPSVQIVAARILEDTQSNGHYLQAKFVNKGSQPIFCLDVTIMNGNTQVATQHYTDLNLEPEKEVGSKNLISIPTVENYSTLTISISTPSFNGVPAASSQPSSDFSSALRISKKPTVPQIFLLASVVLLISSLALSLCNLFVSNVFYVDDPTWYSANLYKIATELSNASYTRASYPIPFSIYFGVYGYALAAILAILFCLFLAEKKRSTPVLRVIPFLPFGFQLFLISTLHNRSFVDIYDEDNCGFVLRRCSFKSSIYPWLICAGAACLSYAVFLFLTRQRTKNDGAKRNRKKALLVLVEIITVMIVPLIGNGLASSHETKLQNTIIRASLTATNDARSDIAARYGLDEITYSDVLESALTKTAQSNIEQFLEKRDMINTSTDTVIGTLYCIGIVDTDNGSNTYFRVFWKITDQSLAEVDVENSNDDSTSSTSHEYSGYWYNGKSAEPYYLNIQEDTSGSSLKVEVYSDYYKWTATARPSATDTFTYDDGFQQSYSEDFNLPDIEGTITFDFDNHTVTWTDDSGETVTFTNSISASDFNSFVEKVAAVAESYSDDSQPTIEPIDLAGHYWCEQNSGDAYISIYSAPEDNQEVGNIEVYSQLEKANFSDVLYYVGDNTYETTDGGVTYWRLFFYSYNDTPAFELYYVYSPDGSYQDFGEYIMDEHYYS